MKTLLFLALPAALLAQHQDLVFQTQVRQGGTPATFAFIGGELLSGPTVTGAPYSAEAVTTTTQVFADGNRIVHDSTAKIYRDAAGRERREQSVGPQLSQFGGATTVFSPMTIMISDPVAKANYTLDPERKRAMKMPLPSTLPMVVKGGASTGTFTQAIPAGGVSGAVMGTQVMVFSTRDGVGSEPKVENLGKRLFDGVQAEGTRTTMLIPAGQIGNERPIEVVDERWYSPELQVVMMSKHTDPRMGETMYQLNNVSRVEPLATLFEIPPDYQLNNEMDKMKFELQRLDRVERGVKKDDEF
jgi:hypothetical protein